MKTGIFKFQIKQVNEDGTFEGVAAVYGNVDLGNDVIEPGAFTKTLKDKKSEVPLLWQHDPTEPIGKGVLTDSKEGLLIAGQLVLESDVARKAYALMKAGILKGLSIGYDTVVSEYDTASDIRKLKELRLWEVSVVTFPMNPKAQVTAVKADGAEFDRTVKRAADLIAAFTAEVKAGRKLSAASLDSLQRSHGHMQQAMDELSALMEPDDDDQGKSAAIAETEPGLHSAFAALSATLTGHRSA